MTDLHDGSSNYQPSTTQAFYPADALRAASERLEKLNTDRQRIGLPLLEDAPMEPRHRRNAVRFILSGDAGCEEWASAAAQCLAAWVALARAEDAQPFTGDGDEAA